MTARARPSPHGRRWAAASVIVASLALSACAGLPSGDIPSSGPLAVYPRPDAGMDALLEGTLVLDPACVQIASPEGHVAVAVFPAGDATLEEDGSVLVWDDVEYRDGDRIALGGGFAPVSGGYVPAACEGLELFAVAPY